MDIFCKTDSSDAGIFFHSSEVHGEPVRGGFLVKLRAYVGWEYHLSYSTIL